MVSGNGTSKHDDTVAELMVEKRMTDKSDVSMVVKHRSTVSFARSAEDEEQMDHHLSDVVK